VDTFGLRKTAHVYGTVTLEQEPDFTYRFADVFNGATFWVHLKQLVAKYSGTKLFLIIDNGPAHNLPDEGKAWLRDNRDKIELHRLPPYSPEFNPMEGVWKTTRRMTTHNRFYATTAERDRALRGTFKRFRDRPTLVAGQVRRFR
jgi:transposase